jgi:hypothetical protein
MKLPGKVFGLKAVVYLPLMIIIIVGLGYGTFARFTFPKSGWKTIKGCVTAGGKDVNYQFFGQDEWQGVTEDMGCGKTYTDAESWGLKDYDLNGSKSDYVQITILAYNSKPSTYDKSAFEYYAVPGKGGYYIEFGRITISPDTNDLNISDAEWEYIKKSFKFK